MNHFPDQLQSTFISFAEKSNIFNLEEDGVGNQLLMKAVLGADAGYECIQHYNGRQLLAIQERYNDYNERFDFEWNGPNGFANTSRGDRHQLLVDANFRLISWQIDGPNIDGQTVCLRYLRNFYNNLGNLEASIRYEEHGVHCLKVYQQFSYGIDEGNWRARWAQIFEYPFVSGSEEYEMLRIPFDLLVFPETYDHAAKVERQIRIHEGIAGLQ